MIFVRVSSGGKCMEIVVFCGNILDEDEKHFYLQTIFVCTTSNLVIE